MEITSKTYLSLYIKLRSDMLTKSILFLGYSFSDINIKYMFHKLNKLWRNCENEKRRTESYIFLTENNDVQRKIIEKNNMVPIVCKDINKENGLKNFLESIVKELNTEIKK